MNDKNDTQFDHLIDTSRPGGASDSFARFEKAGGTGAKADSPDPELIAERDAFYASHPYESFRTKVDEKRLASKPWWRRVAFGSEGISWRMTGLAGAAAALLALVIIPNPDSEMQNRISQPTPNMTSPTSTPTVRTKGLQTPLPPQQNQSPARMLNVSLGLSLTGKKGEALSDGSKLLPQQRIWFSYGSGELDHLFLVGINDHQEPIALYPAKWDETSVEIAPGSFSLNDAFVLDEYIGPERYIAVFSRTPIPGNLIHLAATKALSEARQKGENIRSIIALPLDLDCAQTSVLIEKVAN